MNVSEQFQELSERGVTCYGYEYDFHMSLDEFASNPGDKVAGRLRHLDTESFSGELYDATHSIKIHFASNNHNNNILSLFSDGDIVGMEGQWENDDLTFHCHEATLLTKTRTSHFLPKNKDDQLKLKHLLILNDSNVAKTIFLRSETIRLLRQYLYSNGYIEIDTPLLHPFQGDSTSKPIFASPTTYDGLQFALASSPELYLKKMLVSGFNKVFTVNKVFRDELIDSTHLMEFTSVEYYMSYVDYNYMMNFTERLLKDIVRGVTEKTSLEFRGNKIDFSDKPWERISIHEELKRYFGYDIFVLKYKDLLKIGSSVGVTYKSPTSPGNIIIDIFEKLFLDKIVQPTFIYDFPKDASVMCYDITMAKTKRGSENLLERFELYIAGMELANCYSELNDPEEQRLAFDNFLSKRNKELMMDATFYHALQVGMPPASGVGFGIDRLVMILAETDDITNVVPFSTYHENA